MHKHTLSARTLWGYGFGDFGQNLVFQTIAIFLLPFYTDVLGLSPALAGLIFLLARPFDGITDPIMGYLAQSYRSRWGTYRPFLLYAAIPGALAFIALFWAVDLGENARFWYALASYLLFGLFFTAYNIPYGTLTAVMTQDYHERGKLTAYRMTFALLGAIVAGYATPSLIQWSGGYLPMALLYAVILVIGLLTTFGSVRENVREPSLRMIGLRDTLQMLRRNQAFWLVTLCFSACFAASLAFSASIQYYFTYYLGRKGDLGIALLFFSGATAVSIPLWGIVSRRIGKRYTLMIGISLSIAAFAGLFVLGPDQPQLLLALLVLHGIGNGTAAFGSWAMPADTIEYGQWLTGMRAEGMTYGIYGVFLKVGMAIGSSLVGLGLSVVGYVPNQPQTPESLLGIKVMLCLLPILFLLIALGSMLFYRLSPERHAEIRAELGKRPMGNGQ